jgi:hypothetical protein
VTAEENERSQGADTGEKTGGIVGLAIARSSLTGIQPRRLNKESHFLIFHRFSGDASPYLLRPRIEMSEKRVDGPSVFVT